jgi:CHAD domain-containing protein/phosphohistidine phosphatase SixA
MPKNKRNPESHPAHPRRKAAGGRFAGVVLPDDSVADAVRKLLLLHCRLFTAQRAGMLGGDRDEPLHDARLALRRYRAVLKTFRPFFAGPAVHDLDERVAAFCRRLSPLRDLDVWQSFLAGQKRSTTDPAFDRYCAAQERKRRASRKKLAALLESAAYRSLAHDMARYPAYALDPGLAALPFLPFAARTIAADRLSIAARAVIPENGDPETTHLLRKRCRAARYRAEFFAPLFTGAALVQATLFVDLFKALSDALGGLHDADGAAARLKDGPPKAAARLQPALDGARKRFFAAYRLACGNLCSGKASEAAGALWNLGTTGLPVVYVVRHATAADGGPDPLRPLTGRGAAEAAVLAKALALLGCRPGTILSSPLVRARATAAPLQKTVLPGRAIVETRILCPEADPIDTLRFLSGCGDGPCLCVGHRPHLDALVALLLREGSAKRVALAKGSVCCIAFPQGKTGAGAGDLVWYFTQKKLAHLVDRIPVPSGEGTGTSARTGR